jgi:peptide deformylase
VPDERLRQKAKRVGRVDDEIRRLVDDMVETMRAAPGVGLAANQVGVLLRVAVVEVEGQLDVLINPELRRAEGEETAYEGCLSYPGYVGEVTRAARVEVKAKNRMGKDIKVKAEGWRARALQHEIDHLDGVLFLDRLTDISTLKPSEEDGAQAAEEQPALA